MAKTNSSNNVGYNSCQRFGLIFVSRRDSGGTGNESIVNLTSKLTCDKTKSGMKIVNVHAKYLIKEKIKIWDENLDALANF